MRHHTPFLLTCCLLLLGGIVATTVMAEKRISRREYVEMYKDIAIKQMKTHGIPASITLAQGCLESGDGNSFLASNANNHFGIKCHGWNGESVRRDDDAKNECFRKYKNAEESFNDHADFIRFRERYSFLFDLEITDYRGWAHGLKKAGYATDPKYGELLIKIIEGSQLYLYDEEGVAKSKKSSSKERYFPPSPAELKRFEALDPMERSTLYKHSQGRTLYIKNDVAFLLANEGDTYSSIAEEYQLFTREILRFNDLKEDQPIAPGTVVYLESKKKKAKKGLELHIAEEGETYYDLSQKYAIRLSSLCKYNDVKPDGKAHEGDRIFLRRTKVE